MSQDPTRPYSAKDEQRLMAQLWSPEIKDNLLAFVMYIFPWGKPGTPLENFKGPREWQKDELNRISAHIAENKNRILSGKEPQMYRSATSSGRGVGKSAFVSWISQWFLSTRIGATVIVTANTESQLRTRTWAEIGKWHTLALNSHWFEKSAMSLKPSQWFEKALKQELRVDTGYYYAQAQLWSEENPDAFAGVHNQKGVMLIFDESSGIPAPIWKVSEGFFTEPTPDRYWFNFSNPRRNTGEFFQCFHEYRDYWFRRNIDSRSVEGTDKKVLGEIIQKYGEDSDEARVEVKGEFPRQGDRQFISREIVTNAMQREIVDDAYAPVIMGVDPARYGDDSTVIRFRQGRNGRIIPPTVMKGADNMAVANEVAHQIQKYNPDAVCIDAGSGSGIIDRLREMKYKVHEVWFGSKAEDPQWADRRTEMWDRMRDWLGGGCIDDDKDLVADLTGPQYVYRGNSDKMALEPKENMKKRGLHSPDQADALALTFAVKVARTDLKTGRQGLNPIARGVDYDVFGGD
jgi:hypothetical protein